MKMHLVLLSIVTLLLCSVTPVLASPIPIGSPSDSGYIMGSNSDFGYPGPDVFSMHSAAPGDLGLSGSIGDPLLAIGAGSDQLTGGGPLGPPIQSPVPEPSGLMVMLGSGLFGVGGLVRRKLRA